MLSKLRFNNEKHINFISVFLIVDLLLIFGLLKTSNATYISEAVGEAPMDVALYAFNYDSLVDITSDSSEVSINMGDMAPGDVKYYKFGVTNQSYTKQADGSYKHDVDSDGNAIFSDTNIVYNLKIITTTNINLKYSLYNTDTVTSSSVDLFTLSTTNKSVTTDGWGTYFQYYALTPKCLMIDQVHLDNYILKVEFPEEYTDYKYQDLVESIKIQLTSRQITKSDADASLCLAS